MVLPMNEHLRKSKHHVRFLYINDNAMPKEGRHLKRKKKVINITAAIMAVNVNEEMRYIFSINGAYENVINLAPVCPGL